MVELQVHSKRPHGDRASRYEKHCSHECINNLLPKPSPRRGGAPTTQSTSVINVVVTVDLMNMEFAVMPNMPVEAHLLQGCCREAERSDLTALRLDGLRAALPESFHGHMIVVSEEIRNGSIILRDLADRSQVHIVRVPVVIDYLSVVLPCLSKSLRDIITYIEDKTLSREIRWRKMYNKMTEEASGLPLPQRFVLYNHFLTMLKYLLTRYDDIRCLL